MDMNALETAIAHGIRRGMYGEPGTAASAIVPLLKLGAIVLGLVLLSKARSSSGVWISDPHHGSVRKQHLQAYLNEFTFRFNRRVVPMAAFQTVLGLIGERQGPTYAGLYGVAKGSDAWRHPNPTCRMRGR